VCAVIKPIKSHARFDLHSTYGLATSFSIMNTYTACTRDLPDNYAVRRSVCMPDGEQPTASLLSVCLSVCK